MNSASRPPYNLEYVNVIQRCLYHKHGVRKGDTVAIYASNSIDYPIIFHAFSSLGAIVTQASPRSTEREMKYHLENSG
jgi:long-chain acyl-CoA synthetase